MTKRNKGPKESNEAAEIKKFISTSCLGIISVLKFLLRAVGIMLFLIMLVLVLDLINPIATYSGQEAILGQIIDYFETQ